MSTARPREGAGENVDRLEVATFLKGGEATTEEYVNVHLLLFISCRAVSWSDRVAAQRCSDGYHPAVRGSWIFGLLGEVFRNSCGSAFSILEGARARTNALW